MKAELAARRGEAFVPRPARERVPELWDENLAAWELFERSRTQFICGPGGAVGLLHDTLEWKLKLLRVPEEDWLETFDKFSIVERIYIASLGKGAAGGGQEAGADLSGPR